MLKWMPKQLAPVVGVLGLGLTLIPSLLVFAGKISLEQHRAAMLAGLVLWFLAAPRWMGAGKG